MTRRLLLTAAALAALAAACVTPIGPDGRAVLTPEANAVSMARPDRVIGNGTPASCTSAAVVAAVARGGRIAFNCGPRAVTIKMTQTARVRNNTGPEIVLDGGGKVTLSGAGQRRILYMNTCDRAQVWTTSHCQNQDHPRLTVQNLTLVDGNATGAEPDGGGAIFVRGGRFKVVNSHFRRNRCDSSGPDVGGGAIRVLSQHAGRPVFVTNSSFDSNVCSNGGATSSIGVSWVVQNSTFRNNRATGSGANPARSGTPGGGNGGAIYLDGNLMSLRVVATQIADNHANEGGGAIFFVSNNRTGSMYLQHTALRRNRSAGFETRGLPGIFFRGEAPPALIETTFG